MIRIQLSASEGRELGQFFKQTSDRKLRDRVQTVLTVHRDRELGNR